MGITPDSVGGIVEYANVPLPIATIISSGKASLYELSTSLSVEDEWDILEVIMVDAHNRRVMAKRERT